MAPSLSEICDINDIRTLEQTPYEDRHVEKSVYDLIRDGALIDPAKIAFYNLPNGDPFEEPATTTYGQFLKQVHQTANLFHSLGIGQHDVVAILLPIIPQNIVSMIAATTAGILCPINWALKADHIAGILNAVDAKVLVALGPTKGYEIWRLVEEIKSQVASLEHVIAVTLPGQAPSFDDDFDLLCSRQNGADLDFEASTTTNDIAIYAHTGGTTGVPKVAQLRHGAIAYKAWAYSEILETSSDHVVFASSPLFHIGGIIYHTLNTLAHGATSLMVGPMGFRHKAIIENYWRVVEKYKITDFFGVPTTLSALASIPPGDNDLTSLRPYCMTGSAGLPTEISKYFEREIGVRILCNYGMTENTATISLPPRSGDPKFGSSGLRLPYTQIRIVVLDADNNIKRDCETNEIGDILVKGPGIMPGYLDAQANQDVFLEDGWFKTGDLGRLDEDEYLWVTGRSKDVIIRSGHNIDPLIIENALRTHPAVALAAAVGQPDSYAGELPVAFVQLKPNQTVAVDDLMRTAEETISERAAVPKEITIVDQLPLTAVGKIFKPDIRNLAATRIYQQQLKPLEEMAVTCNISMVDDATHGASCLIEIHQHNGSDRQAIETEISKIMSAYLTNYEIVWAEGKE